MFRERYGGTLKKVKGLTARDEAILRAAINKNGQSAIVASKTSLPGFTVDYAQSSLKKLHKRNPSNRAEIKRVMNKLKKHDASMRKGTVVLE